MSQLQALYGFRKRSLGCGPCDAGSPSNSQSASNSTPAADSTPVGKNYISSNQMYQQGYLQTAQVLKDAGISYTKNDTDKTIEVTTPEGVQKLPTFIDMPSVDSLVSSLTQATTQAKDAVQTESQKIAADPASMKKARIIGSVVGGSLVLGILYRVFRKPAKRSTLSGPQRTQKRLASARM
jgi:hypothetical protein